MHAPPDLRSEARAYSELRARLAEAYGIAEDDEAMPDTLDGQSDLKELIIAAIREAREREAMAEAIKSIMADNAVRKARHERRSEAIREAVALAMQEAGLTKVEAPDLTVTTRNAKPAPSIVDETQLPDWAVTYRRTPNRQAIKDAFAMNDNFECDGVVITNGAVGITVRTR